MDNINLGTVNNWVLGETVKVKPSWKVMIKGKKVNKKLLTEDQAISLANDYRGKVEDSEIELIDNNASTELVVEKEILTFTEDLADLQKIYENLNEKYAKNSHKALYAAIVGVELVARELEVIN